MRILLMVFMVAGILSYPGWSLAVEPSPVSPSECADWLQYLVPLPKQLTLNAAITLPADRVVVTAPDQADPLLGQAVRELRESLGQSGTAPAGRPVMFTIALQLGGARVAALADVANRDQAYRIVPDAQERTLWLAARAPRGLYYAAKTLGQLIRARATGDRVAIPLADVTDWPDLATRGVWGVDASSQVRWLSDRKFNHMEQIASSRVNQHKEPVATLAGFKRRMVQDGPTFGISPVPAIVHLEQISQGGLFEHYPEVKGQGEGIHEGAICYASPVFVDILAKWMTGYLSIPGVNEVDVWMAENLQRKPGCQCDRCKGENRDLMELRAILAAWRQVSKNRPGARLWILTSEETDDSNELILQALPPDVGFWYYHSLLTYNTSQVPMVPGYLAKAAGDGRNVGVCLNLSAHSTKYQPMTSAQFIHYRMTEFAGKKISGILGYPTPLVVYYRFNVEATAEWSWNAKGRSPSEFAFSWAVRAGMDDPALFAEWAMVQGEVAWDVYGSEWPAGEQRGATGSVARQLVEGKLPALGDVLWGIYPKPWGDIKTAEQLEHDVELADRAVALARQLNHPPLLHESLVVQGYVRSLKALHELKQIVTPQGVADKDRPSAKRFFQMYVDSLHQARLHLGQWETSAAEKAKHRYSTPVCELLGRMIQEMTGVAEQWQLKPSEPPAARTEP